MATKPNLPPTKKSAAQTGYTAGSGMWDPNSALNGRAATAAARASGGSAAPSQTGVNAGSAVPGTRGTPVTPSGYTPGSGMWQPNGALTDVSAAARKAGDSKITSVSGGRTGSGGGGSRVSYIGNDGSKKSGTVKVTPGKTPDFYTQLGNLYQTAYDEQVAANNAALEEAQRRAQEATDAQIAALADQYAGTNRQLYRDYMNSRRVLPQQMAAQGYNGGLSESSMLRLNNSYEEGLNENERARIAQEAAYQQALQQNLYDAGVRTNEANQSARQNLYSQQAALQEAIYRDAQNRAATMAASGDFSEYERLGFSPSEIQYLRQMWRRMNPTLV